MSTFPENLRCALHFLVFLAIFTCCKSTGKNKPLPDFLTGAVVYSEHCCVGTFYGVSTFHVCIMHECYVVQ